MLPRFRRLLVPALLVALSACVQDQNRELMLSALEPGIRASATQAEGRNDYAAAAGQYRSLLQAHPEDDGLRLSLARNLRYAGQAQAAIDLLQERQAKGNMPADLLGELGKSYLAADRPNLALKTLQDALKSDPENWELLSGLGVVYDVQNNFDAAQEQYRAGLAVSPNNPTLLNNLGLSLAQAGKLQEALAALQTAAEQPKATSQVRQNLALVQALSGDAASAERTVRGDLTPEQLRVNSEIYRSLATRSSR